MPLQLSLSARAECSFDVNCILSDVFEDDVVSACVMQYERRTPDPAETDVHFHITFVAADLETMRDAVRRFINIARDWAEAYVFVQTLDFSDEFDGEVNADGDSEARILGGGLYGKLRLLYGGDRL